jgi:hypothetical protein
MAEPLFGVAVDLLERIRVLEQGAGTLDDNEFLSTISVSR